MSDNGKNTEQNQFNQHKEYMIAENEANHGKEVREKYGNQLIDQSNQRLKGKSLEQHDAHQQLTAQLNETLKLAVMSQDAHGELAQTACALHKQWLQYYWTQYSPEAHMQITQMYVDDGRFTAYYEKIAPKCAVFLRDAMQRYLNQTSV